MEQSVYYRHILIDIKDVPQAMWYCFWQVPSQRAYAHAKKGQQDRASLPEAAVQGWLSSCWACPTCCAPLRPRSQQYWEVWDTWLGCQVAGTAVRMLPVESMQAEVAHSQEWCSLDSRPSTASVAVADLELVAADLAVELETAALSV